MVFSSHLGRKPRLLAYSIGNLVIFLEEQSNTFSVPLDCKLLIRITAGLRSILED
jgi:hypothetical protein